MAISRAQRADILDYLLQGWTVKDTAAQVGCSEKTVRRAATGGGQSTSGKLAESRERCLVLANGNLERALDEGQPWATRFALENLDANFSKTTGQQQGGQVTVHIDKRVVPPSGDAG